MSGAYIPGMNLDFDTNPTAYMCREGKYCDNTLANVENDCAAGKYMPRMKAEAETDCLLCKPGYECQNGGTVTPTDCPSGFFCVEGTATSVD